MARALAVTGRLLVVLALGAAGCGPMLPPPRFCTEVDKRTGVEVPSPPPPGQVVAVPPPPKGLKHPVWVDGEQEWLGHRWVWKAGGWRDQAPDDCYFPPATQRIAEGKILHVPGIWMKSDQAR